MITGNCYWLLVTATGYWLLLLVAVKGTAERPRKPPNLAQRTNKDMGLSYIVPRDLLIKSPSFIITVRVLFQQLNSSSLQLGLRSLRIVHYQSTATACLI